MSKRQSKTPLIYALEPRLLFDGDLGADVASSIVYRDGNSNDAAPAVAPENQRETQRENISFEFHSTRSAIVFIDGGVEDPQTLADAAADVLPDDAQIHILDSDSDGFAQINDILQNHDRVDEIHIFGHGKAGEARLGTASLSLETLTTHSGTLAVLKDTLTEDGDILLYGCNIAAGEDGRTFIEELAELTAADIAASDDLTGAGGDWELEVATGPIETETVIVSEYLGRLSNGVTSTTSVTEAHSATDLESGAGHAGDGLGIQITQEQTGIQTDADLNFNLGSNLTNDASLQLDTYLVYRNTASGNSGSARIVFDNGIAGINWVDWRSDDSGLLDAQFAKTGASYDDLQGRGLEGDDRQNVSFSGRALNITGTGLAGDTNGDYMRVFVYSSPATITAVDDAVSVTESVKVEAGSYQSAANIDLTTNDTTTTSSKRVVGLGSASDNINENPSHLDIGSLGLSAITGVYGELRVASDNTISYWVTDDAALETALANNASVTETFYYRVANEFGSEDDGEITVTIDQANDRPVANPYTITRDYDSAGFTIGTSSAGHPLVSGGITDADDSGPFVFSGIHVDTSSAITLSDAASGVALTDFGTVTVNANDELVFTPDAALADLPQGQSLSRSFIYFVSDDGGAYNEGSDGVDRSDKITITINGTANIPIAQVSDVARFYFENKNNQNASGSSMGNNKLDLLNNTVFSYSASPNAHAQHNLQNGSLIDDLWTVEGAGNTIVFDAWTDADGNDLSTNGGEYSAVTSSNGLPDAKITTDNQLNPPGSYAQFDEDGNLDEGDTGTYTWYYRVNVVNNGNVISSAIGQLDVTLEGTNDVADTTASTYDGGVYDETNGTRITTPVTQTVNIYDYVQDADDLDTIRADKITITFNADPGEENAALAALDDDGTFEFTLLRGETTDDANWDQAAAWGELANHFSFTLNENGTIDWVSKRDQFRSQDGKFYVYLKDYTEISGRSGVSDVSHTDEHLLISKFNYSPNDLEFIDDSVAVNSSANGAGSVNGNDAFFSSLASFQRSTGSYNVRVAAGETIVGEYITLTMDADGDYTYTVNQGAFDALGDGETASESFTYWGASNPNAGDAIGQATLTFNLTGLADAFVAVDDTARVVTGATISGSSGDLGNQSSVSVYESSGTLISNDINDVGDLTVVGVWLGQETINATPTTIPPGGNVQVNGTYGVLTIYANGGYDYVANSGVTSEETEYFTYTVRNGDGEDDTAELAITILPAADNEFVVEDLSHTMNDIADEAGLTKTVTIANLLTHDANAIRSGNEDGASYAITGYAAGDSGSGFSNVGDTIRGTYGTLTINTAGVPTYVFDRPYSLDYEERGYDVFTFEVTDSRGSPTTNTAQLTVQINGLNTTPSWSDDAAITITEDTGVTLTKYGDLAAQGSNNATGYNTALTGGWANYLEDEFGDVDGYQFSKFDNASVERSSYSTTEGWTAWRSGSGQFQDTTIGSATNQNSILIGSVPFGNENTNDKITIDNTIQVGQSDVFNVSGELTGNINIRGTFDVTVIGVQNTPVVDLDDDSATEPTIFRFGNFYQGGGGGTYPTNTVDLFSNDTTSDYSNILRIEISADGASGWTAISQDSNGNAAPAAGASILSGSDFYWRGDKYYAGESYIEFLPSNFEALPAGDDVTGSFYYRIVEVDGTTSSAAQVSATLTPTDDPPEVHRQGAVLDGSGSGIDSSGSISVGASDQPNWNNNDGTGFAKPPSGVSSRYIMGNNGDDGDGVSISEVDMPGEHTGGLLDKSNSTSSADPEDNSVILSVTPRYMNDATASELSGLGNNSSTSVTLRGNHGELTVNEDGSYSYTADLKRALNWSYSSSYENYDYVDSFDIELGPTGVGGAGSVTTTLDIFFDGTDGAPVAGDDTAHVREDANISVSGNAAESTAGGDDDNAVDAPGEHSGNLLANDTDDNPNANLQINAAGVGNSLSSLNLGAGTDNPYRQITGTYGTLSIYQDGSYTYVADQAAADDLAAGQTANDVFGYRVIDNNTDTDTASLTITVHGTANETYDREVTTPENETYDFVHTISSNVITATDFWTATEVDSSYNPPIQIISLPHSGTLRIGTTDILADDLPKQVAASELGTLNYVPPVDTNGDDYTFFNYQILDVPNMGGVTVTMTIDITPDPNNAAPTITDPTAVVASIAEIADGTTGETTADIEASGSFTIADGDSDSVSVSVTSSSTTNSGGSVLGTLTPTVSNNTDDGAGVVTWSYAINDSDLDTMAVGDSFTETFTLTIDDGNGGTVTQDIVITVNGTNDAPVAQADSAAVAERQTINVADGQGDDYTDPVTAGTSTGDVLHTAAASHADSDVDGDTLRVSAIAPVGGDTLAIASGASAQVNGAHGVLTMYGHGGYDYTANRNVTSEGATETDSFTYTVSDDNGGTTTASLQITITDVPNNPPTIEAQTSVTGSVTELDDPDATEDTANLTASGSFTIADLDNDGVTLIVAETGTTYEGSPVLGALTATVDNDTAGDGNGVIVWNYTIANSDIGGLDVGQSFSETFTITVADAYSGSVTQDVTVTVNGANDVPDIQNDSYTVIFGNTLARDAANGVLANDSDDDDQDVLIVDAAAVSAVDFNTVASGADMTELAGTYGSLTIDTDGSFTYTPDANNAALQALDGTETVTETFYIDVHDGNATNIGAGGRNVNQLDIIISGMNDAPVAVDDVISVTVGTPATGNIIDPDINADDEAGEDSDADGDTLTVTQYQTNGGGAGTLGQALQGVYGTLLISADGSYTYTVDETNAQVIAWGPGDTVLTEAFNYTISDTGSETASAVITVNVTGVNDLPEADPIVETRTKLQAEFSVDLITDANATDIDDGDVLVAINDGDESDDEPIATFTRTGTTRVMVTADSGLYLIDDAAVASGGFALNPGRTYIFDWSDATGHPVRLSETADGTHVGGGVEYVVGVTVDADAGTTTIVVTDATPALYAYCENHAAMGFGTPVEAYDVPDSSYTLIGSTLTVNPQVFADLAADNEVEIAIAYKIADGDVADDETYVIDNTATITITGLNTKPQIIDDKGTTDVTSDDVANVADVTTPEDTTYVFTLDDFNYVDQNNDPMASVLITQGPLLGELTLNDVVITDVTRISRADIEAGLLKYTPPADDNGDAYTAFTYAVNDGKVDSDVGAMTIHVTPVNDEPEADPIVETRTKLQAEFSVDLITDANATDIDDGDVLVAINDGDESDDEPIATFTRTGTTRVMVTADSGLYLIDDAAVASGGFALNPGRTYIFDWSDATGHPVRLSETADGTHVGGGVEYVVGVTVDADAGTTTIVVTDATPALYAYCENHAAMGFGTPVEAYDVPDSSYTLIGSTLTVNPQVFADLAADNEVEIAIAYKIADGDVADDETYVIDNTATITITGLNTKPQIIDDKGTTDVTSDDVANVADVTTPEDTTYVFTLDDFNYVDQNNDPMASVLITQGPLLGELTLNDVVITDVTRISRADIEAGLLKYTPPADDNGDAYTAFTYAVNDGKVDSDVGAMTIHVTPVNDEPSSDNKFVRILGERTVQFGVVDFAFRDKDAGDTLDHITLRTLPANGTLYLVPKDTVLPAIIDPPMSTNWAISGLDDTIGHDIARDMLAQLIYVANEAVKTNRHDEFTFTVNDGSSLGPLNSESANKITLGKNVFVQPVIEPKPEKPVKFKPIKPKEKTPALNPHDLPPVMKVSVDNGRNRQIGNEVDRTPTGGRDAMAMADDNANLGDDSWLNAKTSSQLDISGNIRVIDLKVKGREIAVEITDEASDRAESFKGELADGSPLPDWIKVDRNTGLTTAEPPAGTKPFEMRVVAEDGGGNKRAIDLILDPTALNGQKANDAPAPVATTPNAANEAVARRAPLPTPEAAPSRVTANVLADGQVAIGESFVEDATGSLKLMRMVSKTDGITVEITDDARADQTRYEVRQKDGSVAPNWVQVDARTGELTIDAPENVEAIELTLVALDGGSQRTMDLELDLDKLLGQDAGGEESLEDVEGVPPEDLGSDETEVSPVSSFVPFDKQIDAALVENSYGRNLQQALSTPES